MIGVHPHRLHRYPMVVPNPTSRKYAKSALEILLQSWNRVPESRGVETGGIGGIYPPPSNFWYRGMHPANKLKCSGGLGEMRDTE